MTGLHRLGPAMVALVGVVSGVGLWSRYWPQWRQLWTDLIHDRSAHLDIGLGGASDLVHLRFVDLMRDVNALGTWPPLHDGVLVGLSVLMGGSDPRLAVLPDLCAYIGAAVVAFLLARRLVDPGGTTAGAVAATFVLVSPAHRAFATDVMIEGPGAFFSLLALYAAVRARQENSEGSWRGVAIALSALFFVKYNYWFLVAVSLVPLLLRHRGVADPSLGLLVRWHLLPAALWLALPGKLVAFLWVLWPGTNAGEVPASDRLGGITYYRDAIAADYHVGAWSAVLMAVLLAVAVLAWGLGRLRPGASTVLLFLVIATVLTVPHPNRKSRFLHSWLPAAWVAAGAGVGALAGRQRTGGRGLAIGVGALVVTVHLPELASTPHAPEGGIRLDRPSALQLTDTYLPYLADARRPAVLSNVPLKFLARWTYLDRYGRGERVRTEVPGFDASRVSAQNADAFDRWLASGANDAVVLVQLPRASPWYVEVPGCAGLEQFDELLRRQHRLTAIHRREFAERGGATVTVWKRAEAGRGAAQAPPSMATRSASSENVISAATK